MPSMNVTTEEVVIEEMREEFARLEISVELQPVGYGIQTFGNLPPGITLKIFSFMDQCTSVCLGLTSQNFWAIHVANYPKPTLFARTWLWTNPNWPRWQKTLYLFRLLKEWMGNKLTEEDVWMHEEVIRLIKEIRDHEKKRGQVHVTMNS